MRKGWYVTHEGDVEEVEAHKLRTKDIWHGWSSDSEGGEFDTTFVEGINLFWSFEGAATAALSKLEETIHYFQGRRRLFRRMLSGPSSPSPTSP